MSDEELLAAFKDVVRARNPAISPAARPAGPLTFLERLPEQIKGLKLNWPWPPEPTPAEGRAAQMGSSSTEDSSAGVPEEQLNGSSSPQASKASLPQGRNDSARETEQMSKTPQEGSAPGLSSMSPSSQPVRPAAEPGGGTLPGSLKQQGELAASQSSRQRAAGKPLSPHVLQFSGCSSYCWVASPRHLCTLARAAPGGSSSLPDAATCPCRPGTRHGRGRHQS